MCALISSKSFAWNISYSKNNGAKHEMYIGLQLMYPLFLIDINETGLCSTDLRKILKYQSS